ncbi:MAG: glycerophosphodiester phosphodiesterase [Calditrichaeota bacterium]|nr:glycerophosphodiester phosphodiesterase [Calditrichota bacterium]RQW02306.1 MAG: glycerophosphodiester phosphodiesterase [Calditrichota bacterium]
MIKIILRIVLILFFIFLIFACFQYFYGGSPDLVSDRSGDFEILAHRGVHVNWKKGTYHPITGCEATHIYKPSHNFIENTIESIDAAFSMGATIVEIDIRRTKDNHLIVFHDDRLECRTNGKGRVVDYELAYLKTLDIGYGYTYDDGKTYPFRGKGIGKLPALEEVLVAFSDKKFLIDNKDGSMKTVEVLAGIIKNLPPDHQKLLFYWGTHKTYAYIQKEIPSIKRLLVNRGEIKKWFKNYFMTFGLSGFPEECKGLVFAIPPKYSKYIWGWPYRFIKKVHDADAKFYLYIDTEEEARKYADFPADGVVTDYIEIVGKYFKNE